jgi:cell division protein FtsL
MSTIAQDGRAARARPRPRAGRRPRLLAGGVVSIVLFAVLLSGVVAVNVAVLRLNLELDRAGQERSELKADIAGLRAQLSSASATARIERLARKELGLVEADPETTVYLRLTR